MEPLALSLAFASIIGLMSNFKSERKEKSDNEFQDFIYWLENKRHLQIKQLLEENKDFAEGVKNLLNRNQEDIINRLQEINNTLLLFSSKIDGLKEISHALAPNIEISDQAISIIDQLEKSGGSYFSEMHVDGGTLFRIMDGKQGYIDIYESRFIKHDLQMLENLDLLIHDQSQGGKNLYHITRLALKLLEQTKRD